MLVEVFCTGQSRPETGRGAEVERGNLITSTLIKEAMSLEGKRGGSELRKNLCGIHN